MKATKGILEAQLEELTVQQELVIKSTRAALENSTSENKSLKQRIEELEKSLTKKRNEIAESPQKNRVEDDIERELIQTRSAKKENEAVADGSLESREQCSETQNPLNDKLLSTLVQSRIEQKQRKPE